MQLLCFKETVLFWFSSTLITFAVIFLILLVAASTLFLHTKIKLKSIQKRRIENQNLSIGFFHPYCNSIGGEQVFLWNAISVIHSNFPESKIVVYTVDIDSSPQEILKKAERFYNISVPQVEFVYLQRKRLIEVSMYPYFTSLCQSFGSLLLALEAINSFLPDIFIDSAGYAFTLPLCAFLGSCKVAAYIHHPAITPVMIKRFDNLEHVFKNQTRRRNSGFSLGKVLYFKLFSWLYSLAGKCTDVIMVNSTWTENYINSLWGCPSKLFCVYPPCGTSDLHEIPLDRSEQLKKVIKIVSIGQFKPVKDHPMQLKVMYQLRQLLSEEKWNRVKLVIVGSTQSEVDEVHVKDMQDLCRHLSLENNVEFKINLTYSEKKAELESGLIGLHTMKDENFGIAVVEMMAAGLVVIAHGSGGPKSDIIEVAPSARNGFFGQSEIEFADKIASIINCPNYEFIANIQQNARASAQRFSSEEFRKEFLRCVKVLFNKF